VIRSKMDVGPDKIRQRVTAGVRNFAVSFAISDTQFTTLDDFFTTTVKGGALSFDFPHPRTGATISVRFTSAPEYQPRGRGGGNWIASFTLEEIPA